MKHTPGQWIIRYNSPSVEFHGKREGFQSLTVEKVGDGLRSIVAELDNWKLCDEHGDILSNARLIAAAPELLEALKDAEFLLRKAGQIAGPMQDSFLRSASDARAAISKAEGGQ